jgi:undecaprenyl-diphosphatase
VALLLAFWRDWWNLVRGVFARDPLVRATALGTWAKLAVASLPAVAVGLALESIAETHLRWLPLQATMLVVFGALLWWVDRRAPSRPAGTFPGWGTCLAVGGAQALSLVPGVSRSGVTMTAGRACGLPRVEAARFSFLLGTPITFGAGLVELPKLGEGPPLGIVAIGVVTSALVGWLAIHGLLRWLGRAGFGAFLMYRLLLAAIIAAYSLKT